MGAATQTFPRIEDNIWFQVPNPQTHPRFRLFCFSYAGGNASVYRDWYRRLPVDVELCSIQLPGRGSRFREPAFTRLEDLLSALCDAIVPYLGTTPFAFFGHSMGAQVAYELARKLRDLGLPQPSGLFVSGRRAPQLPSRRRPIHDLPEDEFQREIRRLNGTPEEALQNQELMALVSPILRADCQVIETWRYQPSEPLNIPLLAMGGIKDEHVSIDDLESWGKLTRGEFEMRLFSGDHFYIHSATDAVLSCINGYISRLASHVSLAAQAHHTGNVSSILRMR
jgi:medium-chain acyl-[acyl-carrier-protein] hydrolase